MGTKQGESMDEILKRAFRESGMSLKRLADESGTRYASVHAFFTAERDPQLSTVEAWCRVLRLELHRVERAVHGKGG